MKVPAAAIALCGFVIAATACAPTADQAPAADEAAATEADVEALKALEETVVAAFKAGEIDPMAALYPEDVVVLAPNQPALVGKNAVLAWLQGLYDQFTVDEFTSPVEEVVVADGWAFSRGVFAWTLSPKAGGEPVADSGNFIVIWRRAPDGWKRARVIWNSDNPLPGEQ
jgi:ketosteroid isomerase-like protein